MKRPAHWRLDVVTAINYWQQISSKVHGPMADLVLEQQGYPPKLADRMLEDAAEEGLIEYGVSARTGWLTDKGRALLLARSSPRAALDAIPTERIADDNGDELEHGQPDFPGQFPAAKTHDQALDDADAMDAGNFV